MAEPQIAPEPPSGDEQSKSIEVGKAMGQARVDTEGQPREEQRAAVEQAGRDKADEVGLPVTDEQIKTMAGMIFGELSNLFEQRGAFDAPPEPVSAPSAVEPAPREAEAASSGPTEVEAPRKKSWAERYFGS